MSTNISQLSQMPARIKKVYVHRRSKIIRGLRASTNERRHWSCPARKDITCVHMENNVWRCQAILGKAYMHQKVVCAHLHCDIGLVIENPDVAYELLQNDVACIRKL